MTITKEERYFFDELFADDRTALMYLASLMDSETDLQTIETKQHQLRLLNSYFIGSKHPKKDYYLQKLDEIARIIENDRRSSAE